MLDGKKTIKKTFRLRVASVSHINNLRELYKEKFNVEFSDAQIIGMAVAKLAQENGIGNAPINLKERSGRK